MTSLSSKTIQDFNARLKTTGDKLYRPMPWREDVDPYYVFVSEVMLQQTQVDRVIPKFEEFMHAFPTIAVLAQATFPEVLAHWSGLGYNRRALWLHESAKTILDTYAGIVPADVEALSTLKGIGPNTASAICVYAFQQPHVFIETNVRTVFIHEFFSDRDDVHDDEIRALVEQTLDRNRPREWYWAVMDYGTSLKKSQGNPSRKSAHHTVQSRFEGSRRQVRGQILKTLLVDGTGTSEHMSTLLEKDTQTMNEILSEMERDGLIVRDAPSENTYRLRT